MSAEQSRPLLAAGDAEKIEHVYEELLSLANHPIPAVRGGVRVALGEVAQVMNAIGGKHEAYGRSLAP